MGTRKLNIYRRIMPFTFGLHHLSENEPITNHICKTDVEQSEATQTIRIEKKLQFRVNGSSNN